jgi:hypothetical protein
MKDQGIHLHGLCGGNGGLTERSLFGFLSGVSPWSQMNVTITVGKEFRTSPRIFPTVPKLLAMETKRRERKKHKRQLVVFLSTCSTRKAASNAGILFISLSYALSTPRRISIGYTTRRPLKQPNSTRATIDIDAPQTTPKTQTSSQT